MQLSIEQPLKFFLIIVRFEFNYFSNIKNFYKSIILYSTKLKLHKINNIKWACYIKIIRNIVYLVNVGCIGIYYMMVTICTILNVFHTFVLSEKSESLASLYDSIEYTLYIFYMVRLLNLYKRSLDQGKKYLKHIFV